MAEHLPVLGLEPADVANLPPEALPALLAWLAALQGAVAARLASADPAPRQAPPPPQPDPDRTTDRWLTVSQVAERLGRDARWVYRRAHSWDFTVKDGRTLAFSESGLRKWMERHRVGNGS